MVNDKQVDEGNYHKTGPQIPMERKPGGEVLKKKKDENKDYSAFIYCHWTRGGATDAQSRSLRNVRRAKT